MMALVRSGSFYGLREDGIWSMVINACMKFSSS